MASAQQLIGLIKSHAEGDSDRFCDLAMQLSAAEEQKGHKRLAEQLRQWAEAGQTAPSARIPSPTPIAAPRGDLAQFLAASYPSQRLKDVILPSSIEADLAQVVQRTDERSVGKGCVCTGESRGPLRTKKKKKKAINKRKT